MVYRSSMAPLELGPAVLGPRSSCADDRVAGRAASGAAGGASGGVAAPAGGVAPFELGPAAELTAAASVQTAGVALAGLRTHRAGLGQGWSGHGSRARS